MFEQNAKRVRAWFFLCFCTIFLQACGQGEEKGFLGAVELSALNVTSIQVFAESGRVSLTETEQFVARAGIDGATPDSSSLDVSGNVTWTSSDSAIASVDSSGVATGVSNGTVQIRAQWSDLYSEETLLSSDAALDTIRVENASAAQVGVCTDGHSLKAWGVYVGETLEYPITEEVSWSSGSPLIADVGDDDLGDSTNDDKGIVSAFSTGTATITASHQGKSANTTIQVQDTLTSVAVTPDNAVLYVNDTQQFLAEGTYTGSATAVDITETVNWTAGVQDSSGEVYLTISDTEGSKGLATASKEGAATATATCAGSSSVSNADTVNVTVNAAVVVNGVSIDDADSNDTVTVNVEDGEVQLKVYLTYSNSTTGTTDVADDDEISWSYVSTRSGTQSEISNTTGTKGLVTFSAVGETKFNVNYKDDDAVINIDTVFYVKVE